MSSVRFWSREEIAWGRECLAAGDSVEEIAEAAGCSRREVLANIGPGRLTRHERAVVSLYVAGSTLEAIQAELGLGCKQAAANTIARVREKGVALVHKRPGPSPREVA